MWEDPAIRICSTFFLGPSPPQYIRDGEWSAKLNLIPICNKNKIDKLHKPPFKVLRNDTAPQKSWKKWHFFPSSLYKYNR